MASRSGEYGLDDDDKDGGNYGNNDPHDTQHGGWMDKRTSERVGMKVG